MISDFTTAAYNLWDKLDKASTKHKRGFPLVDSPTAVAFAVVAYLLTVKWGPKFMEKRKPFKLKGLLIAYNFCLVLLNIHIAKDIFLGLSRLGYAWFCGPGRDEFSPEEMKVANAVWLAYITKYLDLADSLFFILRKKSDQLSGLHIYHHASVLTYGWIAIKWYPGGAGNRAPAINGVVHVIMYTYYGLSAMGPKVRKYLWWKKYLTGLQLIQFLSGLVWSVNSLVKGCNHHWAIDTINILYMCSFIFLFGNFYLRKYKKKVE